MGSQATNLVTQTSTMLSQHLPQYAPNPVMYATAGTAMIMARDKESSGTGLISVQSEVAMLTASEPHESVRCSRVPGRLITVALLSRRSHFLRLSISWRGAITIQKEIESM